MKSGLVTGEGKRMYRRLSTAARLPNNVYPPNPKLSSLYDRLQKTISPNEPLQSEVGKRETREFKREDREVVVSHPWSEWVSLLELLCRKGYLDRAGLEDPNHVRTACLQFARDRTGLIRYLSREEIHTVANCGCPSIDRKVVNSGKRLRAYVGIDEGDVCSRCSLRGNCERAYVKTHEEGSAKTIDVMRILLTYGLDITTGSVQNGACLTKPVKESVKKLTSEVAELGLKQIEYADEKSVQNNTGLFRNKLVKDQHVVPTRQGDWICPKCKFMNFAKNLKCLKCSSESEERYNVLREEQEHLPLKPGDWICQKCNFLNFAKNTECLQCREKPTNRLLNTGEWECQSCNYVNFRRNEHCRKCGWKRPKILNSQDTDSYDRKSTMSFVSDNMNIEANTAYSSQRRNTVTKEELDLENWNDGIEICDFPILGGKSAISRDQSEREKWKEEMLRKTKGISTNESEEFSGYSCSILKSMDLGELSDNDEEIKSWFIHPSNTNKDVD